MTIVEVVLINEYEDRESGEIEKQKYTIDGHQLGYIVKSELTWREFYNYINAITRPVEVAEK